MCVYIVGRVTQPFDVTRTHHPTSQSSETTKINMTLYYSLVFLLLVSEMVIFGILILPIPFTWRRRMFTFISTNPLVARAQYGLKVTFIGVLILFIDSVNRVYRVAQESEDAKGEAVAGHGRAELQARKFYSQRNMYLCGFTIFLSVILNRTYGLIVEVLNLEEKMRNVESGSTKDTQSELVQRDEIEKLKDELRRKNVDLDTLMKQSDGLSREYDRLGDQVNSSSPAGFKKDN